MIHTRRDPLLSLLIGGSISVISFIAFHALNNPYPAGPGLLVVALIGAVVTGNPHFGFRTALGETLALLLSNFVFYPFFVCVAIVVVRLLRRRSG